MVALLKLIEQEPSAGSLLNHIGACRTIREGVRPLSDSTFIDASLLHKVFSPKVIRQIEVLPVVHSLMFLFPETFLKVIDLESLFFREIMSITLINRVHEDNEMQKFNEDIYAETNEELQ